MICELCGEKGAFIRRVNRTYGRRNNRDVVESIPIVYCPNCQQTYYTSETMQGIEEGRRDEKDEG